MIRVLVVEDSAVVREYLGALVEGDPRLRLVGTARDGVEAVEQTEKHRPDVVLMDLHMPRKDGLAATREIMSRVPTPIVLVSASFVGGETTMAFDAMQAGALTVLGKPVGLDDPGQAASAARLLDTLSLMSEVKVVRRWPVRAAVVPPRPVVAGARPLRIVAIGASTGGPAVVADILKGLPGGFGVPILLVQHIAPGFAAGLAEWLGQVTPFSVKLADPDELVRPGTVYVAEDGTQLGITSQGRTRVTRQVGPDGFCPSVSHLFESVAGAYGRHALGVLLTGMGQDGAAGLRHLRDAGGMTVAQDEETSVVFGMPQEAIRLGAAEQVLKPEQISLLLRSLSGSGTER